MDKLFYTTDEIIDSLEESIPGFKALVAAERKALHDKYPDPVERAKYIFSKIEKERIILPD